MTALTIVDIRQCETAVLKEFTEAAVPVYDRSAQFFDLCLPLGWNCTLQTAKDDLLRLLIEMHVAPGGEKWKVLSDGVSQAPSIGANEGTQTEIESKFSTMTPHEVQHRAHRLSRAAPQATTQLLEKECCAFRWSQHEDGVNRWNVNTLIEHIDGKYNPNFSVSEIAKGRLAIGLIGRTMYGHRSNTRI